MRVRHEWQRLPIAAILLIFVAAVAAPRLRYRVQNAGSRTRMVRPLRLDDLTHNITLSSNDLAIGVGTGEQPVRSPKVYLPPLRGEENSHFLAVAGTARVWLLERRAPANKPSATSGRAPPLFLLTSSSTKTISL